MSKNFDKPVDKEILKKLEEFGLTEKESRVYVALLPRQNTGTSNLIRATGLHGQFVYQALDRLEQLGLAKHVIQSGRKKFSANSPSRILALVEEKKLSAQVLVRQLEESFIGKYEQDFEVFQGQSAFVAHEFALLKETPEGSVIDAIGGGGDKYIQMLGTDANEYERMRVQKRIAVRYISSPEQHNYLKIMAQTRVFFEFRLLPGLTPGLVDTDVWPGKIIYHMYGDPVVSFVFKNKDISESQHQFFEVLWNLSSK